MNIANKVIRDQDYELSNSEVWILGPKLTFERCRVTSRASSSRLTLNKVTFLDCEFTTKVKLLNSDWSWAKVKGCKFIGTFHGCDFGKKLKGDTKFGEITDCDFAETKLDGCRFFSCDIASITLPMWPYFTITDHRALRRELDAAGIRGDGEIVFPIDRPLGEVACVYSAKVLMKEDGFNEKELHAFLEGKPYVIM